MEFSPLILPADPHAAAALLLARDATMQSLGLRLVSAAEGSATLQMTVGTQHLNATGVVHGGVIFTLADSAFAIAACNDGQLRWAAHAAIEFLRPTRAGQQLQGSARRVAAGLYDIEVRDDTGQIVALMRGRARRARTAGS
jgi:acyl-CoA thioesterase